MPGHERPLLWTSDEIATLTDLLDHGQRQGVHLLDAESVFQLCVKREYKGNQHYKFAWRKLLVERTAGFGSRLESFMREIDGRAFPSLEQMALYFAEGKMGIHTNTRTYYCSELATDTYLHLQLLPASILMNGLPPGDFSSAHVLPLRADARLEKEVWFTL